MRKEAWFGLSIMAAVVIALFVLMPPLSQITNGHLGLLMLALIVVAIMLGFPTAFTLMGLGTMFTWFAYNSVDPSLAVQQTLDLMVQRAYWVMTNDVLISVPLFVFMGYLVERANLIQALFKGLHLATARIPGSLAVATIVTCAIFATASGIIGAVVTLMGLLAFPAMLKAGYNVRVAAGAVTAGGTLGILIPPSVLLILYGATAGVSVMQLYAGAFFPGLMLAGLYVVYVIVYAKIKPSIAPPLSAEDQYVQLPKFAEIITKIGSSNVMTGLIGAIKGKRNADVPMRTLLNHLGIALLPAWRHALLMGSIYLAVTARTTWCPRSCRKWALRRRTRKPMPKPGTCRSLRKPADCRRPRPRPSRRSRPLPTAESPKAPAEAKPATPPAAEAAPAERKPVSHRLLDHARHLRGGARGFLCDLHLRAARDLQDAAGLLLPAGAADHRGPRLHRHGARDAERGGGDGVVRGVRAGDRLWHAST